MWPLICSIAHNTMRSETTAGNGTTGYTFLVLLSSLANLEGHKNNVCDPMAWYPTKEQHALFLKYIVVYNVAYTVCINSLRQLFFFFFSCMTYCMQRDSLLILCGASFDIGGLFFKTNAKWKESITLQRPDRWCTNSLVLVSLYSVVCTSKEKKRKLALLWSVHTEDPCVLSAYSHHHSVLLTATAIWDCRPHRLLHCCLLCCYSDI